jgi:hypothetical protein
VRNWIVTEMVPSSVPLSGRGLSFFSGFRNLIFFFFPPDFKKNGGKGPTGPPTIILLIVVCLRLARLLPLAVNPEFCSFSFLHSWLKLSPCVPWCQFHRLI